MTVSTGNCYGNVITESINGGDIQKKQEEELAALGWLNIQYLYLTKEFRAPATSDIVPVYPC